MNKPYPHAEHKDVPDARWHDKASNDERQRTSDLKKHHSPCQARAQRKATRLKEMAEPANIAGVQERMDGVGDENQGHHDLNDIETAARIACRTAEPVSLHKDSCYQSLFPFICSQFAIQAYDTYGDSRSPEPSLKHPEYF